LDRVILFYKRLQSVERLRFSKFLNQIKTKELPYNKTILSKDLQKYINNGTIQNNVTEI